MLLNGLLLIYWTNRLLMCICYRPDTIVVMTSIGNQLANSIWEANAKGLPKPKPTSPRWVADDQVSHLWPGQSSMTRWVADDQVSRRWPYLSSVTENIGCVVSWINSSCHIFIWRRPTSSPLPCFYRNMQHMIVIVNSRFIQCPQKWSTGA